MHLPALAPVVFLCCAAGCDSSNGTPAETCPIPGSIFVANGPQGSGCYCAAGTVPNTTGDACVSGDPCGPYGRTNAAGACEDIDECADGTGCDAHAICTNVTNGPTRCACTGPYFGDGTTCAPCGEGQWGTQDGTACEPYDGSQPCTHGGVCSSLADPEGSPYPDLQCAGTIGPEQIWFQTHQKTSFPVDCRCPHGGVPGEEYCAAPTRSELAGTHLGTGPNAADLVNGVISGCATNFTAKVVYFGANWGTERSAMIFAMDPLTHNRTLVSGEDYNCSCFGRRPFVPRDLRGDPA